MKRRSVALAATVIIHGDTFATEPWSGPLFPAEPAVIIPLNIAWKEPMATEAFNKLET